VSLAYVFPGQGSQYVGMGTDFLDGDLEDWFVDVCGRTNLSLEERIRSGPAEELEETRVTQPAVFVVNQLVLRYLQQNTDGTADYYAGHSLGEYNALAAAGWASFDDLLPVVVARGQAMGEAADRVDGSMAALLRMDTETAEDICQELRDDPDVEGSVQVALYNSPSQIVLSGAGEAFQNAMDRADDAGALKVVELDVSGPWHSTFMEPAEDPLQEALDDVQWSTGDPVVTNVSADFLESSPERGLLGQLTEPVRWIQSVRRLLDEGVRQFVEVGPGDALTGMIERITDDTEYDVDVFTTDTLEQTRTVIEEIES
jgi:[acyl-carrier-protein] S-malonyltransferase